MIFISKQLLALNLSSAWVIPSKDSSRIERTFFSTADMEQVPSTARTVLTTCFFRDGKELREVTFFTIYSGAKSSLRKNFTKLLCFSFELLSILMISFEFSSSSFLLADFISSSNRATLVFSGLS